MHYPHPSSSQLPSVFLLDGEEYLHTCAQLIPVMSGLRSKVSQHLLLSLALHIVLDTTPDRDNELQLCTIVNSFAASDIGSYKYAFTEEILLNLYQWYFETYLRMLADLNHFFPEFSHTEEGLPYTVKLYDALLRFDQIPIYRDYAYVTDRTR